MSNNYQNWEDDDDLDFEEDDQPAQRTVNNDPIKNLRKALRAAEKRNKELEAQVGDYSSKQRDQVIQKVLADRGVNPKIAKLIPSDIDATNADALSEWLEEYGDAFGIPQGDQGEGQDLSELKRINSVTSNANMPSAINDIESKIDGMQSEEELYAYLQSLE